MVQPHQPSDFSFDTYPGLDRELAEIYARNVDGGNASPDALATAGLAATVGNAINHNPNMNFVPDVYEWARQELETQRGMQRWFNYKDEIGGQPPLSVTDLEQTHPEIVVTLNRLYEAKNALSASDELTPENVNIGDTMHLVAVPWQAFRNNINNLQSWINQLRTIQGVAQQNDYVSDDLVKAIQQDTKLYRDPKNPNRTLAAIEYLDHKIAQDGPWGLMLAQTSDEAGLKRLVDGPANDRSPDSLTHSGISNFTVAGEHVDAMGIYEWLALTLHEDPSKLSTKDYSWLLANRLETASGPQVPGGYFSGGQVRSYLDGAGDGGGLARVRLAVM